MTQVPGNQLDKILALADSDHEGEALVALRMARQMLEREGLNFSDLAQAARRRSFSLRTSFFASNTHELEEKIDQLQDDIAAHVEQNESLSAQIEFWRRRAFELEQLLNLNQAETARWRDMARETAERLWDLGQIARAEAFLSDQPVAEDDPLTEETQRLKAAG